MNPTLAVLALASLLLLAAPAATAGSGLPDVGTCDAATDPCGDHALACVTVSSPTIRTDPVCLGEA